MTPVGGVTTAPPTTQAAPATAQERRQRATQAQRTLIDMDTTELPLIVQREVNRLASLPQRQFESQLDRAEQVIAAIERGRQAAQQATPQVSGETPKFSVAQSAAGISVPASPLSDQAFDREFARVTSKMNDVARQSIVVVPRPEALPQKILDQAYAENNSLADIRGSHYNGISYIVRSAIKTPADLQEAVFHEVFGHGGLRKLMGQDAVSILSSAFDRAGGMQGINKIARAYNAYNDLQQYIPDGGVSSRQQKAALMDELLAQAAGRATGGFKQFALEVAGRIQSSIVSFLRRIGFDGYASALDGFGPAQAAVTLARMREAAQRQTQPVADNNPQFLRSPAGQVNQTASTMMQNASRWADSALSLGPQELRRGVRNAALYVSSLYNVVRTSGDLFKKFNDAPSITGAKNLLENIYNLHRRRSAVSARFSAIVNDGWTEYNRLQATDPKAGAVLNKVMDATAFGINPEKKWNDPEHASLKGRRNEAWLKAAVDEANQNIVRLKQNGGLGYKVYTEMRNTSDMTHYASMAVTLQNLINSDPIYRGKISAFETDPMQAFLDSPALHQDAAKAKAFWRQQLDQRVQAARKYLVDMTGRDFDMTVKKPVDGAPAEQSHINILRKRLGTIDSRLKAMDRVPYFHLGRVGKYFASFNVRTKEVTDAKGKVTKVPDQAALQRIAEVVEGDGFNNFRISPEVDKATVFLRVETADQLDRLKSILAPLTKDGTISGDVKAGDRLDPSKAVGADAEFLNEAMQRIKSSPMFEADDPADQKALDAQRGKMVSLLAEVWINMLPDTAEARVMTKRDAIAGWSSDMARSYAERMNIGILALANLSTAAPMSATFAAMRQNINDAKLSSSNVSTNNVLRMQDVFNELRTREVETNNVTGNDWIDTFRAINYAYFLGASPAYVLTNLTQIPIILLPELARKHGFANSAKAIARNTGLAMNIMKEVFKQGWDISARQAADASITNKALDAVLKDDTPANNATKEFILRLVNTGIIDIGNAARELGRVAEGRGDSRMDNILRYAGAMGLYSETFSRLMAALASRDLIEQKIKAGKQGYSQDMLLPETLRIVDETMLNYSAYNIARATGRQGALGRATPIATSFNQYSFQVLEKLYRDMYDAFSSRRPGEDDTQFAARRSEARTFLFSHAAMLTVLAGSLGLPFATVAAAAANSLKDLFDDDDQPADVVAAYRNYLSQMLGKDAAEVLARGVPRALGFDMSARVGEQNILPFSRFLSDRRKWEDTFPELMADLAGSPFGMVGNVAVGLREMANGNTLEGMQTLLPTALRNVTAAYRMTERGYTDTRTGQALPMEAGARDVLTQLIGFAPAELAEYREARVAQASREGIVGRQATNIRTNIAKAIEGGDAAAAREWIARAREFDANNPTSAILPRIGSVIQQRALARAQAETGNVPLGVNLRDINARQLTAYANF